MRGSVRGLRRGQPLIALGLVLVGWVGLRALLWEDLALPPIPGGLAAVGVPRAVAAPERLAQPGLPPLVRLAGAPAATSRLAIDTKGQWPHRDLTHPARTPKQGAEREAALPAGEDGPQLAEAQRSAVLSGSARLAAPPVRQDRPGLPELVTGGSRTTQRPNPAARRWSVDGWLLLRQGGVPAAAGGLPPATYGASQAGGVVRYHLAPANPRRPAFYLRATSAVERPRGEEAALGLALRPVPRVPVALTGEVRVTRLGSGTALRPAVSLVTELERFRLPLGAQAEVYAQGGYVGGAGATPFIDAQVRVERRVMTVGPVELRAGAGAWGGAQQGANRIDVGPAVTFDFPLAGGRGRIAADWRLRAAGNAAPQSGPALTLSAGF